MEWFHDTWSLWCARYSVPRAVKKVTPERSAAPPDPVGHRRPSTTKAVDVAHALDVVRGGAPGVAVVLARRDATDRIAPHH